MSKRTFAIIAAAAASVFAGCLSAPPPVPQEKAPAAGAAAAAQPAASEADALKTMRELRDAARAAFDSNHPVEALRHLVSLLAVDDESAPEADASRRTERAELARKADAELTAIGARFTMEPTDEWIAEGKQLSGSTRDLAKGSGLKPAVRLVVNYDFGKAVVADAPVRFAFAKGIGDVGASGTTNANGVASASVRSIARVDEPVVIRAVLAVSSRGRTKVFSEVFRDFTYLPSTRTARVVALERTAGADGKAAAAQDYSPLVDAVSRGLSDSGLELLPSDGALDPAGFMAALNGDPSAVAKALSLGGAPAAFLVIAASDCDAPRQMVLQGKAYEIYTAIARATVRVLRSDGSVVDARPQVSARGQAGTPDAAVKAALKAVREAVEKDLRSAAAALKASLD